jgi:hypothetical protein
MVGVPDPWRGTERGLRCGDRLHDRPSQLEVMRMGDVSMRPSRGGDKLVLKFDTELALTKGTDS